MVLLELINTLHLNVIESTISEQEYTNINFYTDFAKSHPKVLYVLSKEEQIDDATHSFLFLNHLPKGKYKNYILIDTNYSVIELFTLIQNVFISAYNEANTLSPNGYDTE